MTLISSIIFRASAFQAGRRSPGESGAAATLNVIVELPDNQAGDKKVESEGATRKRDAPANPNSPDVHISPGQAELYDAGILQQIDYLRPDYSPARIVFLVDNSETLRASTAQLGDALMLLVSELYEGDQAMVVAYDRRPDVLEEFTSEKPKLRLATSKFRKGEASGSTDAMKEVDSPRLLDAMQATLNDALRLETGISKRLIVLLSDGYDRESETSYNVLLQNLQRDNVVVYAVKFEDRTRGVSRRKALKPEDLLVRLTAGTGGRIIDAKRWGSIARGVMREIAERWFQLAYHPRGVNPLLARRLLLLPNDRQIRLRTKAQQPPEPL